MPYRVELNDEVAALAAAFNWLKNRAWFRCVVILRAYPWECDEDDYEIRSAEDKDGNEYFILTTQWFEHSVSYVARQYGADDGFPDGDEGIVRVFEFGE